MNQSEGIPMNAARPIAKLVDSAGSVNATLRSMPSLATQRYCISVLCHAARGDDVEQLIRRELRTPQICVHNIGRKADSHCKLVRVIAVVSCAARARTVLFWLVNRLGTDPDVRLVRWETAAPASSANAQQQFDTRARRPSLAGTVSLSSSAPPR
jgi:hypothetical protein